MRRLGGRLVARGERLGTRVPRGQLAGNKSERRITRPSPAPTAAAMPQGKLKLKKSSGLKAQGLKKAKPVRGDQQKLRKGNFVFKAGISKNASQLTAQNELTKKITARIEQTMAARASQDGGGLSMIQVDGDTSTDFGKKLKPSASILAKKLGKKR